MYDDLKILVNKQKYQDKYQIEFFANCLRDRSILKSFYLKVKKILPAFKAKTKHRAQRATTTKWKKKDSELMHDANYQLSSFLVMVSEAYQETHFLLRILYMLDKQKNDIVVTLDDTASLSFATLYKYISLLDSTDKESYGLFNKFRNVIFHTPFEHLLRSLDADNLYDFVELANHIYTTNESLKDYHGDELDKIMVSCVIANFEIDEYELIDDGKKVNIKTDISV